MNLDVETCSRSVPQVNFTSLQGFERSAKLSSYIKSATPTFDVFQRVTQSHPDAANIWLAQLEKISEDNIKYIFNLIQVTVYPLLPLTLLKKF